MRQAWLLLIGTLGTMASGCTDAASDGEGTGAGSTGTSTPCCDTGSGAGNGTGASASAGTSSTGTGAGSGGGAPLPCGDPMTIESGLAPTAALHVATTGSDASGTGAADAPFATIGHAAQLASPGTAIVIHEGTYAGGTYLSDFGGTDGAPIWLGGADGEARPVIQGGDNGLHLSRVRHLVVHDLEIAGGTANGINCDDGGDYANEDATRFVVFRSVSIHDIGTGGNNDCLKLSGVNDFWVVGSDFARCGGGGSGIDHVGCHRGVVARSSFSEMGSNAVQTKGGSADITIVANHFVNAGERAINLGGSTGLEYFRPPLSTSDPNVEARRIFALANVIEGSMSPIAFVGCVDCLAANNTLIHPEHWVLRILQETTTGGGYTFLPASNGRFVNNVVYYRASDVGVHANVGPDTDPASFSFQNNLWYAHDDPGASQPNLPAAEQGGLIGVDPAFVDAASDFHLAAGSPAIGAGAALGELSGDRDGQCYAATPSVGAYERSAP
ncbi:MAG: hypothetical protein JNL21_16735 [Myxococcales bacterium]|nr:hypothetical protein [Myxococcales bacterium]